MLGIMYDTARRRPCRKWLDDTEDRLKANIDSVTLEDQGRLVWKEIPFIVQLMPAGFYPLDGN